MIKYKVLYIEDDRDVAELGKLVLETDNYSVKLLLDPIYSVEVALDFKPDVILLDLYMHPINGWDVYKLLRSDNRFDNTYILILTAKTLQYNEMKSHHITMADAYITIPFGKQELIDKVGELINSKKRMNR